MIDIRDLRQDKDKIERALAKRNSKYPLDEVLTLDELRREKTVSMENLKAKLNEATKDIPRLKKEGVDTSSLMEELRGLGDDAKTLEKEVNDLNVRINDILLSIPNAPSDNVPSGDSDADNVEVYKWGEPTVFDFPNKPHWDLGEELNIIDPGLAAKITGARFMVYKGLGARLERALINFMLDTHIDKHGYTEILPPFLVNRKSMTGTGQLPKFEEDAFKIADTDYFLVPTAEVPVTNLYSDEILPGDSLTIKHCAYTACFRAEAGSAGRDTRGLIRQHQFNKVELVKFSKPENSYAELESLTENAKEILRLLGLPFRVVLLCGGDLGFSSAMTYDIEVWMPSYNRYVEISSCSNFEAYQARRAGIRFKDTPKDKARFVHTLNGSGLAVGRTAAAILENFQQKDGSVVIPEVLRKYMGGIDVIK